MSNFNDPSFNEAPYSFPAKRKHWTQQEDDAIRVAVTTSKDCRWTEIARLLEENFGILGRSSKQCRERWHNHLDPSLSKGPWSIEEQRTLFSTHQQLGNTWASLTPLLPGRSENAIKNQFYSSLRRQYRKWKGSEPSRHHLKKHDQILTTQILCTLNKKMKHKKPAPVKKASEFLAGADVFIALMNIDPIDDEAKSENSTWLSQPDFLYPFNWE